MGQGLILQFCSIYLSKLTANHKPLGSGFREMDMNLFKVILPLCRP